MSSLFFDTLKLLETKKYLASKLKERVASSQPAREKKTAIRMPEYPLKEMKKRRKKLFFDHMPFSSGGYPAKDRRRPDCEFSTQAAKLSSHNLVIHLTICSKQHKQHLCLSVTVFVCTQF